MANISELTAGRFFSQKDLSPEGSVYTISRIKKENVARADDTPDHRYVVYFKEDQRGFVLSSTTNIEAMAKVCGSEETDDWIGEQVRLFVDTSVMYAGKRTGGLRVGVPL